MIILRRWLSCCLAHLSLLLLRGQVRQGWRQGCCCVERRAIHGCTILSDSLSDWCWLLDLMATTVGRLSDILVSLILTVPHPSLSCFHLSISSTSVSVLGLGVAPRAGQSPCEVCTGSFGFAENFRHSWERLGRVCVDSTGSVPVSGSASTGV